MSHKIYPLLNTNIICNSKFSLVPIRYQDIFLIMEWRNQQIYHLRQEKPLSRKDQESYFQNVIKRSFREKHPRQYLFSFLENNNCIGYGGLVHINWDKKEAEISFLIDTKREKKDFQKLWLSFLELIEEIAFSKLGFEKLFTFSYDIRPKLYEILEKAEYNLEKIIPKATKIHRRYYDVKINSKSNKCLRSRGLIWEDRLMLFRWINDQQARKESINNNLIEWDEHCNWFKERIINYSANNFVFSQEEHVGFLRLDEVKDRSKISFLVAPNFRGKGIGKKMIFSILKKNPNSKFSAEVRSSNIASNKIFLHNGFKKVAEKSHGEDVINLYYFP